MKDFVITFEGHIVIQANDKTGALSKWDAINTGELEIDEWDFEDDPDDDDEEEED